MDRRKLLNSIIREYRSKEYSIGSNDCLLMAVRIVKEITGKDLSSLFQGKYKDQTSINRLVLQYGRTFREAVSNVLEITESLSKEAKIGDILLYHENDIPHLGFCFGRHVIFMGEKGLIEVPISKCDCCWRLEDA